MDKNEKNTLQHPKAAANPLSVLAFSWLLKTFLVGYKRDLRESDLFVPLDEHKSEKLGDLLVHNWRSEEQKCRDGNNKKKPSLLKILFKCFGTQFVLLGIGQAFYDIILRIAEPILFTNLLNYFSTNKVIDKTEACYWAAGLIVCTVLGTILSHHLILLLIHIGLKINVACSSLIYRKILRLSVPSMGENTTAGQMVNLLSNDISRFDHFVIDTHYLWIAPLQTIIITYIIYQDVNWASLAGMVALFLFIPLLGYIGKQSSRAVPKSAYRTDDRLRLMNEIIRAIQAIKMYAWEKPFCALIEKSRNKESKAIKMVNMLFHFSFSLEMYGTRICFFISIAAYVYFGNEITVQKVYLMMSYYNILRTSMFICFPLAVQSLVNGMVSIKRIEKFMTHEELTNPSSFNAQNSIITTNPSPKDAAVAFKHASAEWDIESKTEVLKDINFVVKSGLLVAVVGKVGSGKTSLLQAILQELPLTKGSLHVNGKVAYTCQESWIFASSIKQNILFGNEMNKERYEKVIEVCQLQRDLSLLPYGDKTIVGDHGINLSGGQRARINLARAVYSGADINLFDDPLSAVDAEVGRRIFEDCFCKFLREKTIVLVTHQIQYLKHVDHIIVFDEGAVTVEGSFNELQNSDINLTKYLEITYDENQPDLYEKRGVDDGLSSEVKISKDPDVTEMRSYGSLSHKMYFSYFKAVNSWWLVFIVAFFLLISRSTSVGGDYLVSYWVDAAEASRNDSSVEADRDWYVICFGSITILNVIANVIFVLVFYEMCIRASKMFHLNMFNSVIHATMNFFNTNPSGRIINRFSKDIGVVDLKIPLTLADVIDIGFSFVFRIILINILTPWLLIPSGIMVVILYILRIFYMRTSLNIKRLEGITRSPMFDHLSATINGLITIRAFNAQEILTYEFDNHQNLHTTAWYIFITSARAFGMYIDLICSVFIAVTIFIFLFLVDTASPGEVGFVISQSMMLLDMLQWGVRQTTEMENNMTSVERILEYTKLEEEPTFESSPENKPSEEWPEHGRIVFKDLCLMYSRDDNAALKNLNFVIMPREKIGIVGRTGAGKSSLISALFRLAYMKGEIYIDDVPISSLGVHDLRSKISIIPQEPVLFAGSLRRNLDPFDEYDDNVLWRALEDVEIKIFAKGLVAGLHTKISEGGTNFSAGQRQLICLARAIIRKNKVLVLDEATAYVDLHTDGLIQQTVRTNFKDCTVLTIAHRLNTIMDSSRVLVMDAGSVVEFDQPYELLNKKSGYFYELVQQTGSRMAQTLTDIAKESYQKKNL